MRKVILLMHVSLDGFVAGPNGEMDWIRHDEQLFHDVYESMPLVDTALYGRITYQMMESYWPTVPSNPASSKHELEHSAWVEKVQKVVFSRTLETVTWNNAHLIKENIPSEINQLKAAPGSEIMIFGSPSLSHEFMRLGLIDEYRLFQNPILLGEGIPLFANIQGRQNLTLLSSKPYASGVVALRYTTAQID